MSKVQFDREQVVDQSVKLFWRNGFYNSSMQQVFECTNLKPGSIYWAFGSKEGLFREALEQYSKHSLEYIEEILESSESVGEGICRILDGMLKESTGEDYCGCFIVNSQLELATQKDDLHALINELLGRVEQLYKTYLSREYDSDVAQRRATSLMMHIYGIRTYGHHDVSITAMRNGLMEGLSWLPWNN